MEPPGSPAAAEERAPSPSWRQGRPRDLKTISHGALWAGCIESMLGTLGALPWDEIGDTEGLVVTLIGQCLLPYV